MKNTFGNSVTVTLFGESHGPSIGVVIDGLAPGLKVDREFIAHQLSLRRPSDGISTARRETDDFKFESGVFRGLTTGSPLCITIPNADTHPEDYETAERLARPSHADYTADIKYRGFEDYRGGGHFSGRITAALTAAGGIVIPALSDLGIKIGTHLSSCGGIDDANFSDDLKSDIDKLNKMHFAVLDNTAGERMRSVILDAKSKGDSVGGILETAVVGVPAGLGEPWFDSFEGLLSHVLFSIPGVKGIEFGAGFAIAGMRGSEADDQLCSDGGKIQTLSNNSGGINGGITNGMPVVFRCALRPTPTVGVPLRTIDLNTKENAVVQSKGRHDPCIVHRARVVVDSVTALVLCDLIAERFGTNGLVKL